MEIADCYKVENAELSPELLILDPNNPRMSLNWGQPKKYSVKDLCAAVLQTKVFKEILKPKYKVPQLIKSISSRGFIPGTDRLIVKQLSGTKKYLVLEGNRRTAAIAYLINHKDQLRAPVIRSLKTIPVQVFTYIKNDHHSEEEVLEFLLATIQIEGKETWGPMENAYYMYRSYTRELKRLHNAKKVTFDKKVADSIAHNFNRKPSDVKRILGTYNVFRQLREGGYEEASPEYYSLIELAVSTVATRDSFFEFNQDKMIMSSVGLERFSTLCLDPDSPIRNPQDFSAFVYVFKNGTPYEVSQILEEKKEPKVVKTRTRQRTQKRVFVEKLEEVKGELDSLRPSDYRGTPEEKQLITQLHKLLESKFMKLTEQKVDLFE
jgi:hypothetical protein